MSLINFPYLFQNTLRNEDFLPFYPYMEYFELFIPNMIEKSEDIICGGSTASFRQKDKPAPLSGTHWPGNSKSCYVLH